MQVNIHEYPSVYQSLRKTFVNEGVKGLFKGSLSNVYAGAGLYSLYFLPLYLQSLRGKRIS